MIRIRMTIYIVLNKQSEVLYEFFLYTIKY